MAAVTICSDFGAPRNKVCQFPLFPHLFRGWVEVGNKRLKVKVKLLRLFATPWTLGSSVHEIVQARVLEWVAISFSGELPDPGIEPRSPTL